MGGVQGSGEMQAHDEKTYHFVMGHGKLDTMVNIATATNELCRVATVSAYERAK